MIIRTPSRSLFLLLCVVLSVPAFAGMERFWVGGSGAWNDAAHWATNAAGPGGAGVPGPDDRVVIAPARPLVIQLVGEAHCGDLLVDGRHGAVTIDGPSGAILNIGGAWRMEGEVSFLSNATVRLTANAKGNHIDLHGIRPGGAVLLDGNGSWTLRSDLLLKVDADLLLNKGELITNSSMLSCRNVRIEGKGAKRLVLDGSTVVLAHDPGFSTWPKGTVRSNDATVLVAGRPHAQGQGKSNAQRGISICGTGVGQTQFIVNATLVTNYNGFGVRCKGDCNGSVNASITSGGIGPFTFQWIGGPNSATWNNVCAGNQIVIVTDQGQNVSCAATVQVTDPPLLGAIFFGLLPPACAGVCDGSMSVFAVGGAGGYTYDWNNGTESGSVATQLCPGVNTLRITDANNCVRDTTFFINVPPIQANVNTTDVTCFGACDGTAQVTASGGTGTLSVVWSPTPPVGQNTTSASGLCAGNWQVTITDQNGCDTTIQFIITEPPALGVVPSQTDASCFSTCDGMAMVSLTGGGGPYTYAWSPEPLGGNGNATATQLCPGTWNVLITDIGTGCDTTLTFNILSPPAFAPVVDRTDVSCNGACDGTADVSPSGGTPPYSFVWTPAPPIGQGTGSVSGLCPGTWDVLISDNAGCDTTVSIVITEPPPLGLSENVVDASCAGQCDGTIAVTANGGTGPYAYLWDPIPPFGQGTDSISGLCAGNWQLTLTDANGCDSLFTFTVEEPLPLVADLVTTNTGCAGACNATATVTITGGTAPFTYLWTPAPPFGQGTDSISGLCAGPYTLTVTDDNGCVLAVPFTIAEPAPLVPAVTFTPASCVGTCDGTATGSATGGTAPYSFTWDPPPGGGQGTANATGLCPGPYTLTVTDSLGCDSTIAFTILSPPAITTNAVITNATCASSCNGTVDPVVGGGTAPYAYFWTPVPGNGQGQPVATGLCVGDVTVTITDALGCDTTITYTIASPPPFAVTNVQTDITCTGACDGTISVDITGGTQPYVLLWDPIPNFGQFSDTVAQLCPGTWNLLITDGNGCDTTVSWTISEPPPLVADLATTPSGCLGQCVGSASVDITGGVAPYTYFWDPPTPFGQGTDSVWALCTNNYTVLVTDSNGCTLLLPVNISPPVPFQPVLAITPLTCSGLCDAAATVSITGGTAPFEFIWSPAPAGGQGTDTATGLCPGPYTLTITDGAGCDTTVTFTVDPPPSILPNETFTNESCNGPCDGSAGVNPSGGLAPYQFLWNPAPPGGQQGQPNVTGLCAGAWDLTITDAEGCDTTITFTILGQQQVLAIVTPVDGPCPNECAGSASVVASGGVAPYTYLWSPTPPFGQGTDSVAGLCDGQWSVTVTDSAGCDTTITFGITKPLPIVTSLATQPETCLGPCTGAAAVFPSGGTGGYTFDWQPAPGGGQGTFFATGLCTGITYSITVTDSLGCDTTETFVIAPFEPIAPNLVLSQASCNASCDGSATVSPTGGVPPYTFDWSPDPLQGDGTDSISGLCPGSYTLLITDDTGCDTLITFQITAPDQLLANATVDQVSCSGACDGRIVLTPSGGTVPYTFDWSPVPPNGNGTGSALDLCPGNWSVTLSDANGCDTTLLFTIIEPPALLLSGASTLSQCLLCNGTASVQATGGTAPYDYLWTDQGNNTVGTDSSLTGLCAGGYVVLVTDAAGCTQQLAVPVGDSDGEVLDATNGTTTCSTTCDGTVSVNFTCSDPPCTLVWYDALFNDINQNTNTATGLCPGTYYVEVTNASGCVSLDTAVVNAPPPIVPGLSITTVSCAGACDGTAMVMPTGGAAPYVFDWSPDPIDGDSTSVATGLCVGSYTVLITDALGCDTLVDIVVTGPDSISVDAVVQQVECNGACTGSIILSPFGGSGSFQYAWTPIPPNGDGSNGAFDLCAGTWSVVVSDANGCDTTLSFAISEPDAIVVSGSVTPSQCQLCNGTASAAITGGTAPYTIEWTDANNVILGNTPTITGLCAGFYTVAVEDTIACSTVQLVVAVVDSDGEVLTMVDGQTNCANNCDGTVEVDFVCSLPPCTIEWFDAQLNTIALNVNVLNDLCVGDYIVQVTNADGCIAIDTASVVPSTVIVPNSSSTAVSCPGACDGTATVGPVGGFAPYTFDWGPDPINGDGTPQATDLCAGVYTVLITDSTGCDTLVSVLITEPAPLTANEVVQPTGCFGSCDGSITLFPSGGSAPYMYAWSPVPPNGDGTNAATDLCPGNWSVTVTDSSGCTATFAYVLTEPAPLVLAGSAVPSQCQICNGGVDVDVSGGTAPYTYIWTDQNNVVIGSDSALTGLCAGLYAVEVSDALGCSATLVVPVSDVDGETLSTVDGLTSCTNTCDGTVEVVFTCNEPPCTISWFDALLTDLNENGNTVTDLCPGTYYVQVENGLGCLSIDTAMVIAPDPILPNGSLTAVSCAGTCDGGAILVPTGGVGPYTFDWSPDPINGDGTAQVTDLCAGAYTVLISDAGGCDTLLNVSITSPDPLVAGAALVPVTCAGSCDASIVLTPGGGTAPYSFSWSPIPPNGDGTDSALGLCAGVYSVQVSDASGCDTTYAFSFDDPDTLQVGVSITDALCFGDCNGSASLVILGGVAPYSIVWTNDSGIVIASDTTFVDQLCSGVHVATVTDSVGCVQAVNIFVDQAAPIVAALSVTGETCFGPCDGVAVAAPSGGAGGFIYDWSPDPINGDGTPQVQQLCAGSYTLSITDALGCDTMETFTVDPYQPIVPNDSVTDVLCAGACNGSVVLSPTGGSGALTFDWTPDPPNGDSTNLATGLCAGQYSVVIADAVGCDTTLQFIVIEPDTLSVSLDAVVAASCSTSPDGSISITATGGTPGYTYAWTGPDNFTSAQEDPAGLLPGSYALTVIDANGCTIAFFVEVAALSTVVADAGADNTVCAGETLVLDGTNSTGASQYTWTDGQGNLVSDSVWHDLGVLPPGTYSFVLTVADALCSDQDTVFFVILPASFANAGPDQTMFLSDAVTLGGSPSGPSGATFSWQPDSLLNDPSLANPVASPIQTTWFVLTVTTPDGCVSIDSALVTVLPEVVIPTGFTPNGDGYNDTWIIDFIDLFPQVEVEVYNRWGELLFRSVGYQQPWDGRYSGGLVPVGTYYYVVDLNDPEFPEAFTGPLTIVR